MIDYAGAYHQLLISTEHTMVLIRLSSVGNDIAKIHEDIKRAVSSSEDIIINRDIISEDMYREAYDYLASQLKNIIEFANQHKDDTHIAAVETDMRRYILATEIYVSLLVSNQKKGRVALANLVNCLDIRNIL